MRIKRLCVAGGMLLALGSAAAEARDFERLLRGDYAFTGEATCLQSASGFNANLTPVVAPGSFPTIVSFSVHGVRTFNGDGTGTLRATVVNLNHPFALPTTPPLFVRGGAGSNDLHGEFTYDVAHDLTLTIVAGPITGTFLTGTRAGQTLTVTNVPDFRGKIAEHLDGITLAHEEPSVETLTLSTGEVVQRICHRSRILLERKNRR